MQRQVIKRLHLLHRGCIRKQKQITCKWLGCYNPTNPTVNHFTTTTTYKTRNARKLLGNGSQKLSGCGHTLNVNLQRSGMANVQGFGKNCGQNWMRRCRRKTVTCRVRTFSKNFCHTHGGGSKLLRAIPVDSRTMNPIADLNVATGRHPEQGSAVSCISRMENGLNCCNSSSRTEHVTQTTPGTMRLFWPRTRTTTAAATTTTKSEASVQSTRSEIIKCHADRSSWLGANAHQPHKTVVVVRCCAALPSTTDPPGPTCCCWCWQSSARTSNANAGKLNAEICDGCNGFYPDARSRYCTVRGGWSIPHPRRMHPANV